MPWQAKLLEAVRKAATGMTIEVSAVYYDTADQTQQTLHIHTFQFDAANTGQDVVKAVIAEGQQAQQVYLAAQSINASIATKDTVIDIPPVKG